MRDQIVEFYRKKAESLAFDWITGTYSTVIDAAIKDPALMSAIALHLAETRRNTDLQNFLFAVMIARIEPGKAAA